MLKYVNFIAVAAFCLLWTSAAQSSQVLNRIVAVVNGEIITLTELEKTAQPMLAQMEAGGYSLLDQEQAYPDIQRRALEKMINDILLGQEAERMGVEVSTVEVENYINQFKTEHNLTEEQLLAQLRIEGLTRESYGELVHDTIMRQRLLQVMVRRKVVVTDEDVAEYFQQHLDEYSTDLTLRVSALLVADVEQARDLRQRILDGDLEFSAAAKEYSLSPEGANGGDLGEFRFRDLSEVWRQALAGLEQGDVSEPVQVNDLHALLQVTSLVSQGDVSLDDVKEEIYGIIEDQQANDLLVEYLKQLRDKAIIDIRL